MEVGVTRLADKEAPPPPSQRSGGSRLATLCRGSSQPALGRKSGWLKQERARRWASELGP